MSLGRRDNVSISFKINFLLPRSLENFTAYWHFALLALDLSVNLGNHSFLDHLFSSIPEKKEVLMFHFSHLLAEATDCLQVELVMALAVEFQLVPVFVQQLHSALIFSKKTTIIDHILENFNFALCDEQYVTKLADALKQCSSEQFAVSFIDALDGENKATESITENIEGDLIPKDGTLATLARNHWRKIVGSTWPCSKGNPFSLTKRELFKEVKEEVMEITKNEVNDETEEKENNNPKRRKTRSSKAS